MGWTADHARLDWDIDDEGGVNGAQARCESLGARVIFRQPCHAVRQRDQATGREAAHLAARAGRKEQTKQ